MNKRIVSLLLSIVVLVAILCIAIPMAASTTNVFKVEAVSETASPGETIEYILFLQNPRDMTAFGFNIVLPEGLDFVENSEKLNTNEFGETLEFVPDNNYQLLWYSPDGEDFTERDEIELMRFLCKVSDDAEIGDSYVVSLNHVLEAAGSQESYKDISHEIFVVNHSLSMVEKTQSNTISGTITSYLKAEGDITVQLLAADETVAYSTVVYTYSGTSTFTSTYSIPEVADGTYTLRVSKANHVTRDYEVTVSGGDATQDVKICPLGDVTQDGKINMADIMKLARYVKNSTKYPLDDDYSKLCSNVTGDDKVNMADIMKLARYVKNSTKYPLY